MVEDVELVARVKTGAAGPSAATSSGHTTAAANYSQAVTDAIVLSARARQVLDEMSDGQTVAEAWLSQFTRPPDLTEQAVSAATQPATTDSGSADGRAAAQAAMNRTVADLSWLFDAMSPPRVDTNVVAKVLAERMAADAVGSNPPLAQIKAKAEQDGTVAALYVENLKVITGVGGTSASVDRVALTTVDPSLGHSTTTTDGKPVVLDVGGDAGKVATEALPPLPGEQSPADKQAEKAAQDAQRRALLIIRQGGQALQEGTLQVRLDALLPL